MAGLKKTTKGIEERTKSQLRNPKKLLDPVQHTEDSIGDITGAFTPEVPIPEEEVIIPIPDEAGAALAAKKRRARSSRTGRDSTILTEGLGG